MDKFIMVTSLPKPQYVDGRATGEVYHITSFVNVENIVSIMPTTTSVDIPQANLNYKHEGSKVNLIDGSTLTCEQSALRLVHEIERMQDSQSSK